MDLLEMATNKKAVTVYLDNEVLDYVEKYCTEYGVIGKDKEGNVIPRLGTGIHELLKQLLNTPIDNLTEPLKKHNNSTVLSTLDSTVLYEMNERLTKLESIVYCQDNSSNGLDKIVNDSIDTVMDLVDTGKVNDLKDIVSDSNDIVMDSDISAIQSIEEMTNGQLELISPQIAPPPDNEDISIVECELPEEKPKLSNYDKAQLYIKDMPIDTMVLNKAKLVELIGVNKTFFSETKKPKNKALWDDNFIEVKEGDKVIGYKKK